MYILNKKRNITCIFNVSFFCNFHFTSNCRKESIVLKMNITTKTGKSKSTDAFDSRRGQNLKTRFRDAN